MLGSTQVWPGLYQSGGEGSVSQGGREKMEWKTKGREGCPSRAWLKTRQGLGVAGEGVMAACMPSAWLRGWGVWRPNPGRHGLWHGDETREKK